MACDSFFRNLRHTIAHGLAGSGFGSCQASTAPQEREALCRLSKSALSVVRVVFGGFVDWPRAISRQSATREPACIPPNSKTLHS